MSECKGKDRNLRLLSPVLTSLLTSPRPLFSENLVNKVNSIMVYSSNGLLLSN